MTQYSRILKDTGIFLSAIGVRRFAAVAVRSVALGSESNIMADIEISFIVHLNITYSNSRIIDTESCVRDIRNNCSRPVDRGHGDRKHADCGRCSIGVVRIRKMNNNPIELSTVLRT